MGFFDKVKTALGGKPYQDSEFHAGSREARAHWATYQKFQDAQNRVLGEPVGLRSHMQNILDDAGVKYNHKNSKDPSTGERDPNHSYSTRGFNQLANSMSAGEAASLSTENPEAYANLMRNLEDMQRRLTRDFSRENFMARGHAIRAEFEARLPSGQAHQAFDKYVGLMQDKEASARLSSNEAIRKGSDAYFYGLSTIAAAKQLENSTLRAKDAGNQMLEEELGLKAGALEGSILGDPGVMIESAKYFKQDYDKDIAPFRDGNRDDRGFASGSHLMMVGTTIEILEGTQQVETKHADKSLNEYFSALQQERQRPEAGAEPSLGRTPDRGDR